MESIFKELKKTDTGFIRGAETSDRDYVAELKRISESFAVEFADFEADTPTFWEHARALMYRRRWNSTIFKEKTLLDKSTYSRVVNGSDILPTIRTAMAICVGLGLEIQTAGTLLALAGHTFSANKEGQAYKQLFTRMRGYPIDVCNDFLVFHGIAPLGNQERAPRKPATT